MQKKETITIISNKEEVVLKIKSILYILMKGNYAFFHLMGERIYQTRMTMEDLEKVLGDDFIMIKRGCLVSAMAIHNVTDKVNLSNGEVLKYVARRRKDILEKLQKKQEEMIRSFNEENNPETQEEYHEHYRLFDSMPFAFADIEMVFDERFHAIDWVFRYGNQPLAELEKMPLEKMMNQSFSSLFPTMDTKWLHSYERATLYGETLKLIDYSPEIDTYLDIICFPTFKGHCGCIMFDISQLRSLRENSESEKALAFFFERMLRG